MPEAADAAAQLGKVPWLPSSSHLRLVRVTEGLRSLTRPPLLQALALLQPGAVANVQLRVEGQGSWVHALAGVPHVSACWPGAPAAHQRVIYVAHHLHRALLCQTLATCIMQIFSQVLTTCTSACHLCRSPPASCSFVSHACYLHLAVLSPTFSLASDVCGAILV